MTQHCEGEPTISPWRETAQGTWYAIKVCACGEQAEYVEVEAQEQSNADDTPR